MRQCQRCGKWFHETDSAVCNPCWEDMGQMQFEEFDDGHDPVIDTVFDREEEARGYQ